jgi:hypothetical protein
MHIVIIIVAARGMSLAIFTIHWRTMELDLGGLRQPFGMPKLSLGCQLSLEEVNPHLVLASILAQVLDLLSEKQVVLLCRRSAMSARWLPGLEKVPTPRLEVQDSCECLNSEGLRRRFDAASTLLTTHLRSAPPLGGAGGTARSLHSRAMSADWPRTS